MKKNIQKENNPVEKKDHAPLVISYLIIRSAIGVLGIIFPVILVLGSLVTGGEDEILPSISNYYHSNMRDLFVGILCAVSLFLFSYKGYERIDNIAGNLGCIFALGVVFLPTSTGDTLITRDPLIGKLHLMFAALFFLVLIFYSLFLFTKTDKKVIKGQKQNRNRIYRVCGYTMLGCILLIALYFLFLQESFPGLAKLDPVFWLESISLWAFGISWLTKGEILWKDVKNKP